MISARAYTYTCTHTHSCTHTYTAYTTYEHVCAHKRTSAHTHTHTHTRRRSSFQVRLLGLVAMCFFIVMNLVNLFLSKVTGNASGWWDSTTSQVYTTWTDVFTSSYPMFYEVSAGDLLGSGNILQWQETRQTYLNFRLLERPASGVDIHVTLRAISPSGTYITTNTIVAVPPID
jgi:hypothetical protein